MINNELDTLERLQLRREVDPETGVICWYNSKDELHRVHGPAVEFPDGTKYWCQNGQRLRGSYSDGSEIYIPKRWWEI